MGAAGRLGRVVGEELAGPGQAHKGLCLLFEAVLRGCRRHISVKWQILADSTAARVLKQCPGATKEGLGSRQEIRGLQMPLPPTARCRRPPWDAQEFRVREAWPQVMGVWLLTRARLGIRVGG